MSQYINKFKAVQGHDLGGPNEQYELDNTDISSNKSSHNNSIPHCCDMRGLTLI